MLVERKPDVVYAGRPDIYFGQDGDGTEARDEAMVFETREAAEAYRRKLAHPYDWVATGAPK
ncbi:MAG: hypothetical protein EKK30_08235 [Hyphomicrobium sp.]|nr:MAG: hypothetical protein EKK30_08235 [Hyphomicrobium sp.]